MTVKGWIDVHAHFVPPVPAPARQAQWQAMRAENFLIPAPVEWSPERALAYMDRAGIAMQLLSNVPTAIAALRDSNDYGAAVVAEHPDRFGLLAALPTDDPGAALAELERAGTGLGADGYTMSTSYHGVYLGDDRLEPVWAELERRRAVVFVHPSVALPSRLGLPTPLVEVAFETTRSVLDLLYAGVFRRYPGLRLILAHCGGALPALSGRVSLLGAEDWVPNPQRLTREEITEQLGRLYLDTAAAGSDAAVAAALTMVPADHLVYGGDTGAPCSSERTLAATIEALRRSAVLAEGDADRLGHRALELFPSAARRREAAARA